MIAARIKTGVTKPITAGKINCSVTTTWMRRAKAQLAPRFLDEFQDGFHYPTVGCSGAIFFRVRHCGTRAGQHRRHADQPDQGQPRRPLRLGLLSRLSGCWRMTRAVVGIMGPSGWD